MEVTGTADWVKTARQAASALRNMNQARKTPPALPPAPTSYPMKSAPQQKNLRGFEDTQGPMILKDKGRFVDRFI